MQNLADTMTEVERKIDVNIRLLYNLSGHLLACICYCGKENGMARVLPFELFNQRAGSNCFTNRNCMYPDNLFTLQSFPYICWQKAKSLNQAFTIFPL